MLPTFGRLCCALMLTLLVGVAHAGVDKRVQTTYVSKYVNRTFFLKIPVHGVRQIVNVSGLNPQLDRSNLGEVLSFKVGEQVRVLDLDFRDRVVRFRLASLDQGREGTLQFEFMAPLQSTFEQRPAFEAALDFALTEGTSYREVDAAKENYIQAQFNQLIRQFAETTGTEADFVIRTISEQNPEYRKARSDAAQAAEKVAALESKLATASQKLEAERSTANSLRAQFVEVSRDVDTLKGERMAMADERDDARSQVNQLKAENESIKKAQRDYESQINELMLNLSSQRDESGELGNKVENLGSFVATLQSERSDLSGKLADASGQVSRLQSDKSALIKDLGEVQSSNKKLSARLRALTSDKNSINAQFLEMREQKEILETAAALTEALRVGSLVSDAEQEGVQVGEVFLLSQTIGSLRIEVPQQVDKPSSVEFVLLSPDTVKFSEQERELYAALAGDKVGIEVGWNAPDGLGVELVEGEPQRVIAVRDTSRWEWTFNGGLEQEMAAALSIDLVDRNSQRIPLYSQQFVVHPAGIGNQISRAFSPLSLMIGLLAGCVVSLIWVSYRGARPTIQRVSHPVEYLTDKRL